MSRRFSSRVPYRGSMPGVISRDFFIKRSSDLRQDMRGWMLHKQLGDLDLQGSFGRNSAQHRVTSVGLRPDWRGLPIICRSCAQTRTPSAHSQANSSMIPVPQKVHLQRHYPAERSRPCCTIPPEGLGPVIMFCISRYLAAQPYSLTVAAIALLTIALAARPAPGQTPPPSPAAPPAA